MDAFSCDVELWTEGYLSLELKLLSQSIESQSGDLTIGLTVGSMGLTLGSILGTCNESRGDLFKYALTGGRGDGLLSLTLPKISSIPNFSFCFASLVES